MKFFKDFVKLYYIKIMLALIILLSYLLEEKCYELV